MRIAILVLNKHGEKLAHRLKKDFRRAAIIKLQTRNKKKTRVNLIGRIFNEYEGLVFIAALGIVVRLISPFIKDKFSDPAVVSLDTNGRFAVSALSGHEGGANSLSFLVARSLDALPVITTGKEARKKIIVGIGCRRGIKSGNVKRAILRVLRKKNIALERIRLAATIDLKKDEKGLIKACAELGLPLAFIPKENIRNFKSSASSSEVVKRNIGLEGVCEPCALLVGKRAKLICPKQILDGVTVAVAAEN